MDYRPILKLSAEVIGQIAAGEVVERPAAAVKELVENSIDAGATAITVELRDGGTSYIRVSDNGKGIPAAQIRMAFERHATSKLTTADELYDVHTLGFRGEALASIAAIARVACTSRTVEAEFGIKAQVDAGEFVSIVEAASPIGTTVVVKELFYNTPVRLKFLKKPTTEAAMVSDYIMRLILSRPDVAFRFVNQGKTVYRSTGDGTLESAIYCIYGKDALREMHPVHGNRYGVLVDGYVGVGELSRGNRLQQSFFINGRYFRDELVSKALENGCEGYVMIGRFPVCALTIQLPYRLVDVNVHPNKLEVRFQNPDAVMKAVEELAREALRTITIHERLAGESHSMPEAVDEPVEVVTLKPEEEQTEGLAQPENRISVWNEEEHHTHISQSIPETVATSGMFSPMGRSATVNTEWKAEIASDNSTDEPINTRFDVPEHAPALREQSAISRDASENLLYSSDTQLVSERATFVDNHQPNDLDELTDHAPDIDDTVLTITLPERTYAVHSPVLIGQPVVQARMVQEALPLVEQGVQLRYIGPLFKTYLLFEAGERFLMVDQHAAHERVLFDRFMVRYSGTNVSQRLLSPQVLRFTARDVALLSDLGETLTEAGFDIEPFDATSVAVRAIPVILGENEPVRDLLLDVLDETQTQRGRLSGDRLRRRIAQMACKHAIKGGDTLSNEDVKGILNQMLSTGAQPTCPHGRPIVTEMTRRDLEKRFKRIQ